MRKLILCRHAFTNDYVKRIRELIPSDYRVTETSSTAHNNKSPDYLFILSGSRQTQGCQHVKIRHVHGKGSEFVIGLNKLKEFLTLASEPVLVSLRQPQPSSLFS